MAAVWLEDRGYLVAVTANHFAGIVGRTVIDDHDFDWCIALCEGTIERRTNKPCVIEIVYYDADEWLEDALLSVGVHHLLRTIRSRIFRRVKALRFIALPGREWTCWRAALPLLNAQGCD